MKTRLMEIFDFNEADLQANRKSLISPRQAEILTQKREQYRRLQRLIAVALLLGMTGLIAIGLNLRSSGDPNWGLMVVLGVVLLGLPGFLLLFASIRELRTAEVAIAKGPIKIVRVQRRSSGNTSNYYTVTELHIEGQMMLIPDEAFPEFSDGDVYAVYYWNNGTVSERKHIFSVEKMG